MSLDPRQLRDYVVAPALKEIGLWSLGAEQLVMGTGAQESGFVYLAQKGGPALGLWQMEPATETDQLVQLGLVAPPNSSERRAQTLQLRRIGIALEEIMAGGFRSHQLSWNLLYAAAMCRFAYYRHPEPCPGPGDIEAMAKLYKLRYNTPAGAATEAEFVANYRRLVAPIYA